MDIDSMHSMYTVASAACVRCNHMLPSLVPRLIYLIYTSYHTALPTGYADITSRTLTRLNSIHSSLDSICSSLRCICTFYTYSQGAVVPGRQDD